MSDRFKLSTRLAAGFGVLLLLLLVALGASVWEMRVLAAQTTAFADNIVPSLTAQNDMDSGLNEMRRWELRHVLSDDEADMAAIEEHWTKARQQMQAAIDHYAKDLLADDEDKRLYQQTQAAVNAYAATWDAVRTASRKTATDPNEIANVKQLLRDGLKSFQAADAAIGAWWKYNVVLSEQAQKETETAYANARLVMTVIALLALGVGVTAAVVITRSVLRQIGGDPAYAKTVVGEIARGNLAVDIALHAGDNGSLLADMQGMRDKLLSVVTEVRNSSDSIATGSAQIATGNADLSQRTEEQASNLQQTAASMEQLAGTVKNNAEVSSQATQLAAEAAASAVHGGEMVGKVVETMQDISTSSRKIGDIIGVIDGIAFQTNILALNAAVEAARAGEQGRGFAVVAGEVRTLAQRSAEAAREIKTLIGASVEKVEAGAKQVDDAGQSMQAIVAQVQRVSQMISEISNATGEQSRGISQVGDAVTQLDQVTQQNAALVEESAAAAESLRVQASKLAEIVGVFQLAHGHASPARPPMSPRPQATAPAAARKAPQVRPLAPAPQRAAPAAATVAATDDDWSSF